MKQPVKYLKLPFQFDHKKLRKELESISNTRWVDHHYKMNYDGEWTALSLYSEDGSDQNIIAQENSPQALRETPILNSCSYLKEVIARFKCPFISVRLLRLSPGSIIKPHRDASVGYEFNNFRIHIPIRTNGKVVFTLGGENLTFHPGECWYTNVNFTHSVANKGKEDRVHLVIDGERNEWSDKLFFSLAPREEFCLRDDQLTPENIREMISNLSEGNTPASAALIKDFEDKLKSVE